MENQEYEHSFNVRSIVPYIKYCNENGFLETSNVIQNRVVFEHRTNKNVIVRITTETINGENVIIVDSKYVGEKRGDLKVSTESEPFIISQEAKKGVVSLLQMMDFYEAANNLRTRYVYEKGGVKFEIDDYIRPQMKVVAIEGNKDEVDKVYNELLDVISKEKE